MWFSSINFIHRISCSFGAVTPHMCCVGNAVYFTLDHKVCFWKGRSRLFSGQVVLWGGHKHRQSLTFAMAWVHTVQLQTIFTWWPFSSDITLWVGSLNAGKWAVFQVSYKWPDVSGFSSCYSCYFSCWWIRKWWELVAHKVIQGIKCASCDLALYRTSHVGWVRTLTRTDNFLTSWISILQCLAFLLHVPLSIF